MGDYLKEYGKLVDGPDEDNKGLDNFTAAAKVLSTGHRKGTSNMYIHGAIYVHTHSLPQVYM